MIFSRHRRRPAPGDDSRIRFFSPVVTAFPHPVGTLFPFALIFLGINTGEARPADSGDTARYVVGTIIVEQHQVFDEQDTTFFAHRLVAPVGKIANAVHVMTDESVIRRELLFNEGDPYDQKLIDESARHLRRLGIIGEVAIRTDTAADHRINVKVSSRDRWTLRPSMSVRQGGDVTGFGMAIREDNLLGTAERASLGYNRLSDRRNPNGYEASFTEPRLFGSWWSTTLQYREADELASKGIDIQRPFFADSSTWAFRTEADLGRVRFRLYQDGRVMREDYLQQEHQQVWVASSTGSDTKLQLSGAYLRTRASQLDSMPVRAFDNVDLVIGGISILHRDYFKGTRLDNFGRVEDVPVGYQAGLAVGRNLHFSHAGQVDYFVRLFGQESFRDENFFGSYQAMVTSYLAGRMPEQMTVTADAVQNWRVSKEQTFLARISTTIGSHWSPYDQLTLGAYNGLRGYRYYDLAGQRMFVVNLEHRLYNAMQVWFLRLGGALFFDTGTVWNMGEGFLGQKFHSAAGLGIRVESGKSLGNGIFRFDIAYNFDRRQVGLSISTDQFFRAFHDMEYTPPVPSSPAY